MQTKPRFGELLINMASLSGHDVEEILHEQGSTRRRFGEIALAWGLCRPEHIWTAWCDQIVHSGENIDLDNLAIDSRAIECVPAHVAREFQIVPIRLINDLLILATADHAERELPKLAELLGKKLRFVPAERAQLIDALIKHYPA
jgi:type IV pilus assembly protein PilB